MINAAVIGLGRWGQSFVRSVQGKSTEIQFVAAHTRTPGKVAAFCAEHKVPLVDSYEAILRDPKVDAVVLATPHSQHEEQVRLAAAAGKHIHVEKPIALTRKSAEVQVEAARKAGVVLAVGFNRRFHPSIVETRKRLKEGRLGNLVMMVSQQTSGTGPFLPKGEWRLDPEESPAGALTAVGVHGLDHMIEFGGPVREVVCVTGRRGIDHADDTTTAHLVFTSGLTAMMAHSLSTAPNFSFTVYGAKGMIEVSDSSLKKFRYVPAPDAAPTGPVTVPPAEIKEHTGVDMLCAQFEGLAHSIKTGEPYLVSIDEVLHGMSVFDALVESSKTGKIVTVQG